MNNETEEQTENPAKEKIEGIGQSIVGELEIIGGILTGDPLTQAEGEFNVEVGELHSETAENLEETEESEK